ncbi:hypothetical protein FLW53_39700 [Microbispora sp. SCL1-1]|uniref:hypothetical protein n=1 Tax=unclassified Microbispora TaxID=2614687 RepID=UPI00115791A4|nr:MULTISPECIES: hypothetical protein [unclassified Microbispora]NJP30215.1 hypothetical protein [Microbispora sp. CL1-1]TQS02396.1 hypothetical protein FLW53_39700 [Microbispora sp. SCL1-1]
MSYDLHFLNRQPGQSWDDALEAREEEHEGDLPLDAEVWDRIVSRVRSVLGEVAVFENQPVWEIDHESTGIQLSYCEGQWDLSVPYWTHGEAAAHVVRTLRAVAAIIEQETGLECYDPQLERPFSDIESADTANSVAMFDQVAEMFGRA